MANPTALNNAIREVFSELFSIVLDVRSMRLKVRNKKSELREMQKPEKSVSERIVGIDNREVKYSHVMANII